MTAVQIIFSIWLLAMFAGFFILVRIMAGAYRVRSELTPEVASMVTTFTGDQIPIACDCSHKLQGTGGVFYQSVGLLQCTKCWGWQAIREPIN